MWTIKRVTVEHLEVSFEAKLRADLKAFRLVPCGDEYELDLYESAGEGLLRGFAIIRGDTQRIKDAFPWMPLNEQIETITGSNIRQLVTLEDLAS